MSDYISKSALMDALIYCDGLGRKSLEAVVKTINEQPTLDEAEIIRKAFERVVERLEDLRAKPTETVYDTVLIGSIIEIIKEECGISE